MKKNRKGEAVNESIQRIKNMMYYKELSPGQRLIYGDLAKKLNMSVTPIVHALNRLEYSVIVDFDWEEAILHTCLFYIFYQIENEGLDHRVFNCMMIDTDIE